MCSDNITHHSLLQTYKVTLAAGLSPTIYRWTQTQSGKQQRTKPVITWTHPLGHTTIHVPVSCWLIKACSHWKLKPCSAYNEKWIELQHFFRLFAESWADLEALKYRHLLMEKTLGKEDMDVTTGMRVEMLTKWKSRKLLADLTPAVFSATFPFNFL